MDRCVGTITTGAVMKIFFLILSTISLHAQDVTDLFTQANKQYQKNECAQALALYDQIPDKGAATWYNMGNCAYKLNDQVHALLYWKRAYKYGNHEIQKNSLQNMKLLSLPYEPLSHPFANTNPLIMQILFFCIFSVFLIVGYFLIHARRWIFLAMTVATLASVGRITYKVTALCPQALVMLDEISLRAGPGTEYHQLGSLSAGTTVQVIKHSQGWAQVTHNSTRGWIEDKMIERI